MTASVFTVVDRKASKEHICPTKALKLLIFRAADLLKILFSELSSKTKQAHFNALEELYLTAHPQMRVLTRLR